MIIICIIKKLSHNTQHHLPDIVTFFQNRPQAQQRTKTLIIRYFIKHFSHFPCMIQIIIVFLQQIKYASL